MMILLNYSTQSRQLRQIISSIKEFLGVVDINNQPARRLQQAIVSASRRNAQEGTDIATLTSRLSLNTIKDTPFDARIINGGYLAKIRAESILLVDMMNVTIALPKMVDEVRSSTPSLL
jgi:hypothetical protein